MICGLPGVGKSTVARMLAPHIAAVVVSSDEIRKSLFRVPTYRRHEKRLVYKAMLLVARYLHNANVNCILDATFSKDTAREEVRDTLGLARDQFRIIECTCPEDIVMTRLKQRKNDFSDADYSIYKMMKRIYEPIKVEHIKIDTQRLSETEIKRLASTIIEIK
jgi:predicted kinase